MRKSIFFLVIASFFSCNDEQVLLPDELKKWQITSEEASAMIGFLENCNPPPECRDGLSIDNANLPVQRLIRESFGEEGRDWNWTDARYNTGDENRYCSVRGWRDGDPACGVGGYLTRIIEAAKNGNKFYFDIVTLCPPPSNCDRDTTRSQQNQLNYDVPDNLRNLRVPDSLGD